MKPNEITIPVKIEWKMSDTLLDAANIEIADLTRQIDALVHRRETVEKAVEYLKGLDSQPKPMAPRMLWYFKSRSGKTIGHYVERFQDRTYKCSCPGFQFRESCWATKEAARAYDNYNLGSNRFRGTPNDFDRRVQR
jgi:hypothetical protein